MPIALKKNKQKKNNNYKQKLSGILVALFQFLPNLKFSVLIKTIFCCILAILAQIVEHDIAKMEKIRNIRLVSAFLLHPGVAEVGWSSAQLS